MSSVQGKVQILFSGESSPEQAVMNMPLVAGARLEAGADGQAEVEFNDGSVARLTPNSSLELKSLTAGSVELEQLSGLGYYELNVGQGHPSYSVEFASDRVTPAENTIFRVDLDRPPEAAVINGSVHVDGAQITPVDIGENQSIRFSGGSGAAPYTISQGIDPDSWDKWNSDRDQAIAQEARNRPRFAMTPAAQTMRIGMIWTITATGIPCRTMATCGYRAAWMRAGTPLAWATGATIPALELPGSPAIHGAGCLTIAVAGITSHSDGAGLPEAAAWDGRPSSGSGAIPDISCRGGRSSAFEAGAAFPPEVRVSML